MDRENHVAAISAFKRNKKMTQVIILAVLYIPSIGNILLIYSTTIGYLKIEIDRIYS